MDDIPGIESANSSQFVLKIIINGISQICGYVQCACDQLLCVG